ncbi:MAG: hypothetical protein RIC19_13595 [Phaeodactylibacter sp.]|uniref:hypothetical protein n=1 Tax=Phaeodactylibacter sp. TaxID=1940289 RepID=UPI0032EB6C94
MKHLLTVLLVLALGSGCDQDSTVTLRSGNLEMSLDAATGGRIAAVQYQGISFLKTERDSQNLQWGSTVWPAPQSAWQWPPPDRMDKGAYQLMEKSKSKVVLRSPVNAYRELQLEKAFEALGKDTILVTYTFVNQGSDTIRAGIWENARVPLRGAVNWQASASPADTIPGWKRMGQEVTLELGAHQKKHKLYIDASAARLRYTLREMVLERAWAPFLPAEVAPGQTSVEIYYDPFAKFAELELHGPYQALAPGGRSELKVYWTVRPQKP